MPQGCCRRHNDGPAFGHVKVGVEDHLARRLDRDLRVLKATSHREPAFAVLTVLLHDDHCGDALRTRRIKATDVAAGVVRSATLSSKRFSYPDTGTHAVGNSERTRCAIVGWAPTGIGNSKSACRASSIVSKVRSIVPLFHMIAYYVPSSMGGTLAD